MNASRETTKIKLQQNKLLGFRHLPTTPTKALDVSQAGELFNKRGGETPTEPNT